MGVSFRKLLSGIFMVFGTTVGAGMLGIPAMAAGAGFGPAVAVTAFVWLFMASTGLLLLEVVMVMPRGSNVLSIAGRFLGRKGKWLAGFFFLFLYYCLLVAYFSGGFPLIGQVFSVCGITLSPLMEKILFAGCFGGLIVLGMHWINRANWLLSLGMLASYAVVIYVGSGNVQMDKLSFMNASLTATAIPVLFSAFGFHNIVPSLADYLNREKRILQISIVVGTFLALAFYLVWLWLILGSVSVSVLESVKAEGLPVTYALASVSGGSSVYMWGQIFAFLALTTSFLGVGLSFVDFVRDGFRENKREITRFTSSMLTLVPPFICVLLIPDLFEEALGIAGGFGEAALNGILPAFLFAKMKESFSEQVRVFLGSIVAISVGVALLELYFLCR